MMLMPTGPPALIISGLAELAKASELEKFAIAKAMTVCVTNDVYLLAEHYILTTKDSLRAIAAHMFHHNRCSESVRAGVGI